MKKVKRETDANWIEDEVLAFETIALGGIFLNKKSRQKLRQVQMHLEMIRGGELATRIGLTVHLRNAFILSEIHLYTFFGKKGTWSRKSQTYPEKQLPIWFYGTEPMAPHMSLWETCLVLLK